MKEKIKNIILGLISITIFFLLTEAAIFAYSLTFSEEDFDRQDENPENIISEMKSYHVVGHHYNERLNIFGLRDYEYNWEKPDDVIRIALLGDSYTFGHGIKDIEDTYPKKLEEILNNISKSGKEYEVMNFGHPGANILDIYWIYRNKVILFEPDIVIYAYFNNDLEFTKENIRFDYCSFGLAHHDTYRPYSYNFFRPRIQRLSDRLIDKNHTSLYKSKFNMNRYEKECFKNILNLIKQDVSKRGSQFFILMIPYDTEPNDIDKFSIEKLRKISNEAGITYIEGISRNFWDMSKDIEKDKLRVPFKRDNHYNEFANDLLARAIYSRLCNIL